MRVRVRVYPLTRKMRNIDGDAGFCLHINLKSIEMHECVLSSHVVRTYFVDDSK